MKTITVTTPKGKEQVAKFVTKPHYPNKISISIDGKIVGQINRKSKHVLGDADKSYLLKEVAKNVDLIVSSN